MRRGEQPPWIVWDDLWARIEPLLPVPKRNPRHPGRRRLDNRKVLQGILFVLYTGDPVGVPAAGVGVRVGDDLLAAAGGVEPCRGLGPAACAVAGRTARCGEAGLVPCDDRFQSCAGGATRPKSGPSPVDRARAGSKHHVLTEGAGIPLAVSVTGGNRNDITQLLPLLDAVPPVRGRRGRPRRRPARVYADRGYDHDVYRNAVRAKGIRPHIARRGQAHGSGLGGIRGVVERTVAWLHGMKRLRIRWERRDDIHEAFLGLATCIITYRHVQRLC